MNAELDAETTTHAQKAARAGLGLMLAAFKGYWERPPAADSLLSHQLDAAIEAAAVL